MGNCIEFQPPLDENTDDDSVQERVQQWLQMFVNRSKLIDTLSGRVSLWGGGVGAKREVVILM